MKEILILIRELVVTLYRLREKVRVKSSYLGKSTLEDIELDSLMREGESSAIFVDKEFTNILKKKNLLSKKYMTNDPLF